MALGERGERTAEMNALAWSITAMQEATERLSMVRARARDNSKAFAVVGEAVWWVTIVDATMVRYHADTYDQVLDSRAADERELIEQTLAGLRFVRNQMSQETANADFIAMDGEVSGGTVESLVTGWTWQPMPGPGDDALAGRADMDVPDVSGICDDSWELARYRAYQSQLAGHTVGECFDRVVAFLKLATAAS